MYRIIVPEAFVYPLRIRVYYCTDVKMLYTLHNMYEYCTMVAAIQFHSVCDPLPLPWYISFITTNVSKLITQIVRRHQCGYIVMIYRMYLYILYYYRAINLYYYYDFISLYRVYNNIIVTYVSIIRESIYLLIIVI